MKFKLSSIAISSIIFIGCANHNADVFKNINKYNLNTDNITHSFSEEKIKIQKENKINTQTEIIPPIIKPKLSFQNKTLKKLKNKKSKKIAINVENMPIADFIKYLFSNIFQYNYSLDNKIEKMKDTITLNMKNKVDKDEFFNIVKEILNSHRIVIDKKNDIYYIKKGNPKKIHKFSDYMLYGREIPKYINDNMIITLIVPSYYIDLTNIQWMLKRFYLSSDAYVMHYRSYHVMFITDKVKYIKKALNFINLMDTPTLKDKKVSILNLKYINVDKFIQRISLILPSTGIPIAKRLNDLGVLLTPIPELNSVLVISDKKEWMNIIRFWKNKLDIIDINSNKGKIFIYKPQNRDGSDLVNLIKNIFPKTKDEPFNVIFDKGRNTLIFYTTPKKYANIYEMLKKLDILPKQVLIQLTIAEITLKDSLQYGLEWFLKNQHFSLGTLGNLGIGSGGITGSIISSSENFQSLFNMLAQKNLVNILSSPKLIVLNNKTASINVGTQVPVLSSSTKTQNGGNIQTSQSVKYRNTGIILNVTPLIHSNGSLTLKISQTVSDPQPNNTSSISSPIILNRSLNTEVILKSNQSLMLGGLIKESYGKTFNKVPLLGDIPMLGNLFKTNSMSKDKTELIIIVKPVIITNKKEADLVTNKFKNLLINQNTQ